MTTPGKNNINIWLPVIISILIRQLRNIFKSKRPRSSSVFGCSVNWPDWNVTIIFLFFPKMFEITTEKVFQCRWYICFAITKCCHSWTSIQKKGKILQIPLRQGCVHEATIRQDLYILNWKSSYDVMLFTCQNRHQHFAEFWFVWFLGPVICKNTICYLGSSQGMWVYIPCLFSISPEPISNTRMLSYFVYCCIWLLLFWGPQGRLAYCC